MFDFAAGVGAVIGRINPNASTGRFAAATGVLYFNRLLPSILVADSDRWHDAERLFHAVLAGPN